MPRTKRGAKSRYRPRASSKPGPRLIGSKRGKAKGGRPVASPVIPGRRGPAETLDITVKED